MYQTFDGSSGGRPTLLDLMRVLRDDEAMRTFGFFWQSSCKCARGVSQEFFGMKVEEKLSVYGRPYLDWPEATKAFWDLTDEENYEIFASVPFPLSSGTIQARDVAATISRVLSRRNGSGCFEGGCTSDFMSHYFRNITAADVWPSEGKYKKQKTEDKDICVGRRLMRVKVTTLARLRGKHAHAAASKGEDSKPCRDDNFETARGHDASRFTADWSSLASRYCDR